MICPICGKNRNKDCWSNSQWVDHTCAMNRNGNCYNCCSVCADQSGPYHHTIADEQEFVTYLNLEETLHRQPVQTPDGVIEMPSLKKLNTLYSPEVVRTLEGELF